MLKKPHWIYSPKDTPNTRQHNSLWIPRFGSESRAVMTTMPISDTTNTGESRERKLNHISSLPLTYSDSGA